MDTTPHVWDAPAGATRVERTLAIFPMTGDQTQLRKPSGDTRTKLMARLEQEARRRGEPIPGSPVERSAPTAGYRRRLVPLGVAVAAEG